MRKDERTINLTENYRLIVSSRDMWLERKDWVGDKKTKEQKQKWKKITGFMTSLEALFRSAQLKNLLDEPKITKLRKMNDELIEAFNNFQDIILNEKMLKIVERIVYDREVVYEKKGKKKIIREEKIRKRRGFFKPENSELKPKKIRTRKTKDDDVELF